MFFTEPKEVTVKTQKDFDKIGLDYTGVIRITDGSLCVNRNISKASIYVSDNATIKSVSDNATIFLFGLASIVLLYGANKIITKGYNLVRQIGTDKIEMELSKETTFVQVKETIRENPSVKMYEKTYPVQEKNKTTLIMYKAVHKQNDTYFSNHNKDFNYYIGKERMEECDLNTNNTCSKGLHVAYKRWANLFGKEWDDLAILECEVAKKDIIVLGDCDGKVRTSKLKVIRELPKEEYDN